MAGRGSRLRPHTLSIPKPLIPVGGVSIVNRLVEDIFDVCGQNIENIGFVIGDFGEQVELDLLEIAKKFGAKGHIFYQTTPLGTGHAVLCAKPMLKGPTVVAFADTLFKANFTIKDSDEGILWVKKIPNPSEFGVVKLNPEGFITDFIEKPFEFVSDLAMIGVYYFKSGEALLKELDFLVENKVIKSGEYQLPDALRRLTESGTKFKPGEVDEWLDCGNKTVTIHTNQRVLDFDADKKKDLISKSAKITNSVIIPPCFIGDEAVINESVIGPHVSVGAKSKISASRINNSIIQNDTIIENCSLVDSMIGSHVKLNGQKKDLSIGDYNEMDV